jgi:hypothetical protein
MHRFPWGDASGTCNQIGRRSLALDTPSACCGTTCDEALRAGRHPDGRSPVGVSDVLAFPGELTARDADGSISMCGADACVVGGLFPGSIDFAAPALKQEFAFRCAWREAK